MKGLKIYRDVRSNSLESQYVRVQKSLNLPNRSTYPPSNFQNKGNMFYHTIDNILYYYNGTTWVPISGTGNVSGPVSSTLNGIAIFDTITGDSLASTAITVDASDNMAGINDLDIFGKLTVAGLIDPTGLQLTQQASNPGDVNTLWVSSLNGHAYRGPVDLESGAVPDPNYFTISSGTVNTSTTTPTLLQSITTETNSTYNYEIMVLCANLSTGTDTASFNIIAKIKNVSGTASIVVSNDSINIDAGLSGTSITTSASVADININVIGLAGVNIIWRSSVTITRLDF